LKITEYKKYKILVGSNRKTTQSFVLIKLLFYDLQLKTTEKYKH